MRQLLFFIFIIVSTGVQAQNTPVASYEKNADKFSNITDLTQNITSNISNDSLKLLAIYKWVTSNIFYDNYFRRRLEGDTTLTQEPYNVIRSKKAVCIGYSKLIRAMCQEVNIPSIVLEGFAKGNGRIMDNEEHAWNAVKINGNWYLLDATWGADAAAASKYFLTDPSVFVENHLPHDPLWQLLEQPVSFECFADGRGCFTDKKTIFNFRDSLKVWEGLDSISRVYSEASRTLIFNSKDVQAMRHLGEYYMFVALDFFKKYADIRQAVQEKKQLPKNRTQILNWLDDAESYLLKAQNEYKRMLPFAKKNRYTDAHMNIELIDENIANIAQERDFVKKYFKD